MKKKNLLFFDTETTGLPKRWGVPPSNHENYPHMVQLGWQLFTPYGELVKEGSAIFKNNGYIIPDDVIKIHRISNERAEEEGVDKETYLKEVFLPLLDETYLIVGHNVAFDRDIIDAELCRLGLGMLLREIEGFCTMHKTTKICGLLTKKGHKGKKPKLIELHNFLFGYEFEDAHDALIDIQNTSKCFIELQKRGLIRVPMPKR